MTDQDGLLDLLTARATEGLSAEQTKDLHRLSDQPSHEMHPDDLDLAAAAADLAFQAAESDPAPLPVALRQKIIAQAAEVMSFESHDRTTGARDAGGAFSPRYLGWYAAAAMLALAVWLGWPPRVPQEEPLLPSAAVARQVLIDDAADLLQVAWTPPEIAEYAQVRGDVVWSHQRQQGFMRLSGLPANLPSEAQYQLWIVDPSRDKHPIDGGVFDIPEGSAEVVVPIDAKLPVNQAAIFAITLEQPGGVVVSDGPLLVIAAVES